MPQCPVCHAEIPDDFGLLECESCNAQLIVHVDGRVEYSGGQSPEPPELPAEDPDLPPPGEEADFSTESSSQVSQIQELAPPEPEPVFEPEATTVEPEQQTPVSFESSDEFLPPDAQAESVAESYEQEQQYEQAYEEAPQEEEPLEPLPPPPPLDSPDLSDIADFGNSEQAGAREGSLRYNLRITGIDTADIRESFREAITDRKFMWDTDQILRSIRQGEVRIQNIPAVKAHVLISRLRDLPVRVEWEQHAVHQT